MEGTARTRMAASSIFTANCWQSLLSDLASGERLSPEAEAVLNALGQELFTRVTVQACEAAQRRGQGQGSVTPDDVRFAFDTIFPKPESARESHRRTPSAAHEARMNQLRQFQQSQE